MRMVFLHGKGEQLRGKGKIYLYNRCTTLILPSSQLETFEKNEIVRIDDSHLTAPVGYCSTTTLVPLCLIVLKDYARIGDIYLRVLSIL
jgi:hypothetical protein